MKSLEPIGRTIVTVSRLAAGAVAEQLVDGCAIAGAGLITYGVLQIYLPAGLIVGGLFLLAPAVIATLTGRRDAE
jgi:hypothetical protein